jgi:hypothetical protein
MIEKLYLKCCFLNAGGILSKLGELKMHALEYDLNIIGIPKSWLNPDSIEHG